MCKLIITIFIIVTMLCGCGGSSSSSDNKRGVTPIQSNDGNSTENLDIPNNTVSSHYKVLLIGNSHVRSNNLYYIIQQLILLGKPNSQVTVDYAPNLAYLADRVGDGVTQEKIDSEQWTHVILQAQKYSQSGSVLYPTTAAEQWISKVKASGATPILFPEHPKSGDLHEGQYVHDIHLSIIEKQKSCIAPIGLGWDLVIQELPEITLHSNDGNHAAYAGSVLTALIFYQVITGELADALPYTDTLNVDLNTFQELKRYASLILDLHQACDF